MGNPGIIGPSYPEISGVQLNPCWATKPTLTYC